jgi:hypothetical protein
MPLDGRLVSFPFTHVVVAELVSVELSCCDVLWPVATSISRFVSRTLHTLCSSVVFEVVV